MREGTTSWTLIIRMIILSRLALFSLIPKVRSNMRLNVVYRTIRYVTISNVFSTVWHPNIFHDTGAICSALLYEDWSPVYTLQKCLVVLQNLLHAPVVTEPSQAANTEAATSLVNNFETFEQKAR